MSKRYSKFFRAPNYDCDKVKMYGNHIGKKEAYLKLINDQLSLSERIIVVKAWGYPPSGTYDISKAEDRDIFLDLHTDEQFQEMECYLITNSNLRKCITGDRGYDSD